MLTAVGEWSSTVLIFGEVFASSPRNSATEEGELSLETAVLAEDRFGVETTGEPSSAPLFFDSLVLTMVVEEK